MSNKNNKLATSFLRRRLAWLAVLPVALLQLTIAIHQFDHVAEYAEDPCQMCIQLDRVDAAVGQSVEKLPLSVVETLWSQAPPVSASIEVLRKFDSRAPPVL